MSATGKLAGKTDKSRFNKSECDKISFSVNDALQLEIIKVRKTKYTNNPLGKGRG